MVTSGIADVPSLDGPSEPSRGASWVWFLAWSILGAAYVVAILEVLSIGLFILPLALAGTVLVATRRGATNGVLGLAAGLGLPLLYVAYLNRGGPGTVCTALRAGGQRCDDEWNPWPWLVAGLIPTVISVALFALRQKRRGLHHRM